MYFMVHNWDAYCCTKMIECANRRESPAPLFEIDANLYAIATPVPGELRIRYAGWALTLVQSFIRDFGLTLSGPDSKWLSGNHGDGILELNKAFNSDPETLGKFLAVLCEVFHQCVNDAPVGWVCTVSETPKLEAKPPMEIAIVSMPARETSTEIERDVGNNIVQTKQIEQDAA